MPIKMESQTLTIGELLTSSNIFRMPAFQRPYSWGEEEAAQLYDDISTSFLDAADDDGERGYYFLGQLLVSRRSPSAPYDVVDGQQRLVTLSAILAILRDLLPPGPFKDDLQTYIRRPENAARQLLRTPRVALRSLDQTEYDRWISEPGGTHNAPALGETDATHAAGECYSARQERDRNAARRISLGLGKLYPQSLLCGDGNGAIGP